MGASGSFCFGGGAARVVRRRLSGAGDEDFFCSAGDDGALLARGSKAVYNIILMSRGV